MIYTYKYIEHPIQNFHKKIMCFFEKLFELEPTVFDESILIDDSDFIICVNDSPDAIKRGLIEIVNIYNSLDQNERDLLKQAFYSNSDIEKACKDPSIRPVKYTDLKFLYKKIVVNNKEKEECYLKDFLARLWKDYPFVKSIESSFGTFQDHFNKLVSLPENKARVCPFCGLDRLKPSSGAFNIRKRNAYDHIAAESKYPFVSVNLKNLAPICHECNSDDKKAKDVFYDNSGNRRILLHPYDPDFNEKELSIAIAPRIAYNNETFGTLLNSIDWDIAIEYASKSHQFIDSWDDIYDIKNRYMTLLKTYEKEWYDEIVRDYHAEAQDGVVFDRYVHKTLEKSLKRIYTTPLEILRFIYYNYILSIDTFKKHLES